MSKIKLENGKKLVLNFDRLLKMRNIGITKQYMRSGIREDYCLVLANYQSLSNFLSLPNYHLKLPIITPLFISFSIKYRRNSLLFDSFIELPI